MRQVAKQILNILSVGIFTLMIWKSVSVMANTESPVVVVLSGSMEPAFHRGDILFLTLPRNEPVKVNDICVFKLPEKPIPIVHRVVKIHKDNQTEKEYILTKGDNNESDDRGLYDEGRMWIHREHIIGKVQGILPFVGMTTIVINDYPWIKFSVIGLLSLYIIFQRE